MSWRHCIDIDLAALRHNLRVVRELAEHQDVIAVVKADAYGLGIEQCAPIYDEMGVTVLAVAAVSEARYLRTLLPEQRILLLGSLLAHEHHDFLEARAEIWVSNTDEISELSELARTHDQEINIHLGIDTGMNRNGCSVAASEALLEQINADPLLHLAGICTHYPQASDPVLSEQQETVFDALVERFHERLPIDCLIHRANSEGLIHRPAGPCNAVRVGLLLTGVNPSDHELDLQPVLRWSTAVTLVKDVPAGQGISYNHLLVTDRDTRMAVLPVGYADGLSIQLTNNGSVLVHGHVCPILGQVTMDYIMVDVTDVQHPVKRGDEAVLIGEQGDHCITVNHMAHAAQTIPYDILCSLRGRGRWAFHDLPHENGSGQR